MLTKTITLLMLLFAFVFPISLGAANALLALTLLLWIAEGDFKNKFAQIKRQKIILLFFTIGLLTLFSALLSDSFLNSFLAKNKDTLFKVITTHYILLPFIMVILLTTFEKRYIKHLLSAFLMGIFFSEIVSYLVFFHLIDIEFFKNKHLLYHLVSSSNPTPFMHHTEYSVFLSVAAILLIDKILHTSSIYLKAFLILFLLSATINLFINGGRTGQIAYILAVGTYMIFYFRFNIKFILSTVSTLGIVLFLAYNFSPNFHDRAQQALHDIQQMTQGNYNSSWGLRAASHQVVLGYLSASPQHFLLGAGAGDTRKVYLAHAKEHFGSNISEPIKVLAHLHNQYLEYWMDGTLLALLCFLFYLYLLIKLPVPHNKKALLYAFFVAVSFSSMTDVPLFRYQPAMLFYLMTGYFLLMSQKRTL